MLWHALPNVDEGRDDRVRMENAIRRYFCMKEGFTLNSD